MESIYAASTTHTNSNNAKVRGSQSPSFSPSAKPNPRVLDVKDGMKHSAAMTRRQYAKRHKLLDTSTVPPKKGENGVERQFSKAGKTLVFKNILVQIFWKDFISTHTTLVCTKMSGTSGIFPPSCSYSCRIQTIGCRIPEFFHQRGKNHGKSQIVEKFTPFFPGEFGTVHIMLLEWWIVSMHQSGVPKRL